MLGSSSSVESTSAIAASRITRISDDRSLALLPPPKAEGMSVLLPCPPSTPCNNRGVMVVEGISPSLHVGFGLMLDRFLQCFRDFYFTF